MTVCHAIHRATTDLTEAGIANATAEAEWIVAHALAVSRPALHLDLDRPLPDDAQAWILDATLRRARREPLQYILGDVPFCGCTIAVSPAVLIPRPETEWIVETVADAPWAASARSILDVGTGSGAIAIGLAARLPGASVLAVDISREAIRVAADNVRSNDLASRVQLLRTDLARLPFRGRFDLVVSNPPYVRSADLPDLEPEVRDHEPRLALDGGHDGLAAYRALVSQALAVLAPGGRLVLELPGHPSGPVECLFDGPGWSPPHVAADWAEKPRLLTAQKST